MENEIKQKDSFLPASIIVSTVILAGVWLYTASPQDRHRRRAGPAGQARRPASGGSHRHRVAGSDQMVVVAIHVAGLADHASFGRHGDGRCRGRTPVAGAEQQQGGCRCRGLEPGWDASAGGRVLGHGSSWSGVRPIPNGNVRRRAIAVTAR